MCAGQKRKLRPKKETFCVLKNRSFSFGVYEYVNNCQQSQLNCILNMLNKTKYRENRHICVPSRKLLAKLLRVAK